MLKLIVLLASVAYASAGVIATGYGGYGGYGGYAGYGGGYASVPLAYAATPAVGYAARTPVATSYANTYKVSYSAPSVAKVAVGAPALAYGRYSSGLGYDGYPAYGNVLAYGYGHGGYGGYGGYGGHGAYVR